MKINKNDPKLMAYVLNELPASEMKLIAEEIKNNPELQAEVDRLQGNSLLFKKLKSAETVRLNVNQREKIFAQIQGPSLWSKYFKLAGGLAVASLAVVIFVKNESELKTAAQRPLDSSADIAAPEPTEPSPIPPVNNSLDTATEPATAAKPKPAPAVAAKSESAPAPEESSPVVADDANLTAKQADLGGAAASPTDAQMRGGGGPGPSQEAGIEPQKFKEAKEDVAFGSSAGGDAPGAAAPTAFAKKSDSVRSKAFSSSNQGMALNKAFHASPNETDQAPLETERYSFHLVNVTGANDSIINILSPAFFSCFQNSLLRYSAYRLELNLSWQANFGRVTDYNAEAEKSEGPQDFKNEIACLKPKLTEVFVSNPELTRLRKDLKLRLILRSK